MKILRTHKVRIYPTDDQKKLIEKSFGVARFAWNIALSEWNYEYNEYRNGKLDKRPNARNLRNKFVSHVKPNVSWLSEVSKETYSNSILDLGEAWNRYFKGYSKGRPKFKTKKHNKNSYKEISIGKGNLNFNQNRLYIPKFRKRNYLKTSEFPRFNGELKTVTISRRGNKYFASCLFQLKHVPVQYKRNKKKTNIVGIDTGSRTLAHTSDNKEFKISNTNKEDKRIKKLQRKLARQRLIKKKEGRLKDSNNYLKTKTKLQNIYLKKSNKRLDVIHKVTNYIVRNYNNISIEDLKVNNMIKNKHLSKTISESYYYEFKRQLVYKIKYLQERGASVELFLVDPKNTTKTCSNCGQWNDPKSSKIYNCNHCGYVGDRDFNASINIRRKAFGI